MTTQEYHIARIVVDAAVDRAFDYAIPEDLQHSVEIGLRVSVPFGPRTVQGYIVGLMHEAETERALKPIKRIVSPIPYLDHTLLKLIGWISAYYGARMEQCIRTALPGAVRKADAGFREQQEVSLVPDQPLPADTLSESQQRVLAALQDARGPMLLTNLLQVAHVSRSPVQTLASKGFLEIKRSVQQRDPFANSTFIRTEPLALMDSQKHALDGILHAMQSTAPKPILLYGVTGSGKTEVYLQGIAAAIAKGKQAIVLVPEIALTPQTVSRFVARFGRRIAVLHSHLSEGERHDEWHRIRRGEADVVIGARSAIFAPLPDLGLIIVDEEHEPSYKQSETPRYHGRDAAVMRAHLTGCPVVLGSATPALESWQNSRCGKYALHALPDRADYRRMPLVRVIDMRHEAERAGQPVVFAKELLQAMHERLQRREQTMLFLNRRGYASSLVCPKCGFVSQCSSCSVSHTYHKTQHALLCHICGGRKAVPDRCPQCGDPAFRYAGFGTQRLETIVQKCFEHASVARMDTDTTRGKDGYDRILNDFRDQKIDILIGTQMIAKGLHFPNVTLVGIVFADMSLHIPDFRAGERTFQLITQVAGRAGRGEVPGEVFIQTYTPHHTAIQTARQLNYEGFCDEELAFRKELLYPPYAHLICLHFRGTNETEVRLATEIYATQLQAQAANSMMVADATPAPLSKANDIYRYQILIRSKRVRPFLERYRELARTLAIPKTVTLAIDVDAIDLM
jgi:primosomal protein N' (replication factor Y) (superfamily II helicase)